MNEVFTPLNEHKTKRLKFNMSDIELVSGSLNVRKLGKKAVVKIKGQEYSVFGLPCNLENCNCDAYIVRK